MNSKPHVKRRRLSRRGFAITDAYRAISVQQHGAADTDVTREVPVVLFLKGIGRRLLSPRASAGGWKAPVRLAPVIILGETVVADVPDALTRRNRNLSPSARPS